jgi:rhomboid protease GluP
MLDLNHILLFVACLSPLVLLAQTWRHGRLYRAWRLASLAVLLVAGVAWLVMPDNAGFVGGGAWLALLVVPAVGSKKMAELASAQRYTLARRLARALLFLHPAKSLRAQGELLRALQLAKHGDFSGALALLAPLRNNNTNAGRQATAQSFRLRGEWTNLVGWVRSELPPPVRRNDYALMPLYLRALGETGARDELLLEFANTLTETPPTHQPAWSYHSCLRVVLAFCGRLAPRAELARIRKLPRELREFWLGTSELAAGEISAGRARLEKLQRVTADELLRSEIAQRLAGADALAETAISPPGFALLHRIERFERLPSTAFGSETMWPTKAVLIFIILNIAMFTAELMLGGSTNPLTLRRLGALDPWALRYEGEYWRLVTSLFLHYGTLHLLFNIYGLFLIGPGLERAIGSIRFAAFYLLSGLGSSIGVLLWRIFVFSRPEPLVGASGCVMGIVGVWVGFLLRNRHQPLAGRRLKYILLIVAVQTAFDLSTPQISMSAHLSGLVTGLALGLLAGRTQGGPAPRWNA